jgi:hypothetical protein
MKQSPLLYSPLRFAALFLLVCSLLTARFPDPLLHPWTLVNEEGIMLFQDVYNLPFWQAIFHPYPDYFTIAPHLLAEACSFFPYSALPFLYALVNLLAAATAFSFFYLPAFRRIVRSDWQRFVICAVLCAAPNAYPLFRLESVHFYLVILLVLVALMDLPRHPAARLAITLVSVIIAWSAPAASVLIPVFLYRAIRKAVTAAERAVWGIISVALISHILIVRLTQAPGTPVDLAAIPAISWHGFSYRVAMVGIIGERAADQLVVSFGWIAALPFALLVIVLAVVGIRTERRQGNPLFPLVTLFWVMFSSGALIVLRPEFAAPFNRFQTRYLYWTDDRYFFASTVIFFLYLGILWTRLRGPLKLPVNIAAACWCCFMLFWGYSFHYWDSWGPKFDAYAAMITATERQAASDGKIHKLIIPVAPKSWLVVLDVGKHTARNQPRQDVVPSTLKLTDYFDVDESATLLPGWHRSKWLGDFNDSHYPWIFHPTYGWMQCLDTINSGFFFYSVDQGYFYAFPLTFPRIYSFTKRAWIALPPE